LYAVNKGFLDDVDVKKVLAFESGLHQFLKTSHGDLLQKLERDAAKWDPKEPKKDDSAEKTAFKKSCQQGEADLNAAVAAFKKSFT
jgi:F-type H+-transporting ATPase subunit alpha